MSAQSLSVDAAIYKKAAFAPGTRALQVRAWQYYTFFLAERWFRRLPGLAIKTRGIRHIRFKAIEITATHRWGPVSSKDAARS